MFQPVAIAPSILSADFMNLGRDIRMIEQAGAGYVHVDVMDGHFVPNLTMGVPVVKQLAKLANIPLDVHLMIDNPLDELPWFLEAGADIACVHAEVLYGDELRRAVDMIHDAGAKAAVALTRPPRLRWLRSSTMNQWHWVWRMLLTYAASVSMSGLLLRRSCTVR